MNAFENVDNRLRIYRRPKEPALQYDKSGILSQDKVDNIVRETLQEK